jgi:superfamily I DNA and/or RNA helicase
MDLGFLKDHRRMNVMLSRCKKGMIICSSRKYLNNIATSSLVAALANRLGEQTWVEVKDLANVKFV